MIAERRRRKLKLNGPIEPSKEEIKVAKYVRFNTPRKTTIHQKQNTEYFVGSKAIDTLMASKFAKPSKKGDQLISSRSDAVNFMQQLLMNNFLYRAKKVLKERKNKDNSSSSKDDQSKVKKRKKTKDEKEKKKEEEEKKSDDEKKKKKKKKYRLEVHEEQVFSDSDDLFVWVYDPLSTKKYLLGAVVMLGIVGVTLFPLWPPSVRTGVYYLSVGGGIFVGIILAIAVCRSILFALIWILTMGKHHFWFLPNLLADVGFFDSFKPVYTYEVKEVEKKSKGKVSDSEGCEEETNNAEQNNDGTNSSQDNETKNDELNSENIPPQDSSVGTCSEGAAVEKESSEFEVVESDKDKEADQEDDM